MMIYYPIMISHVAEIAFHNIQLSVCNKLVFPSWLWFLFVVFKDTRLMSQGFGVKAQKVFKA